MKRFCLFFLALLLLLNTQSALAFNGDENELFNGNEIGRVVIGNETSVDVYINDYFYKREVYVKGKNYTVINDFINQLFIINNAVFTVNQLEHLFYNNPNVDDYYDYMLKNMHYELNSINYDDVNDIMASTVPNDPCVWLRCSRCGMNPNVVPKTNYKSKASVIYTYKESNIGFALGLSAALFSIISLNLAITVSAAQKIAYYAVEQLTGISTDFYANKRIYQYYHNVCPNAVKEIAVPMVKVKGVLKEVPFADKQITYFYTAR